MTDDQKQKNIDDVPEGFTLIDPNAPTTPATTPAAGAPSDVPAGFTVIPQSHDPGTGGVLQNPGGELPNLPPGGPPKSAPTGEFSSMAPNIPPEQKSLLGFGANVLTSSKNLLENVGRAIIPLDDIKTPGDWIPFKRTSDNLFDLLYGAGRENARLSGMGENLPQDEQGQKSDEAAQAFREYILNNYGSVDKFKEAFYHDPAGISADLSMVFKGGGTTARMLGFERTAKAADTLSNISNPAYLPHKLVSGAINLFAPKLPGAFDPKSVSFGEATGTTPVTPPAAPPEAAPIDVEKLKQEAIVKRAQDLAQRRFGTGANVMPGRAEWLQAEDDINKSWKPPKPPKPPKPAPAPKPAAAPPPEPSNADKIFNFAKKNAMAALTGAGVTFGLEGLAHHIAMNVATGMLSYTALKALPAVLKSAQGQEILARLAKGSRAADMAANARDLVPLLNGMQHAQQQPDQPPIDLSQSPYYRARGGPAPELARIQRERLPLREGTIRALHRTH